MSGDRWGWDGPPDEAYERVTNPERYRPLHAAAIELLRRLEREFAVERLDGDDANDGLYRVPLMRPPTRLVPHHPRAAPITVALTAFPGVMVRFGSRFTKAFPACGCDACDASPDEEIEEMTAMVEAVVSGGVRESIEVPRFWGDGRRTPGDRVQAPQRQRLSRSPRPGSALSRSGAHGGRALCDARINAVAPTRHNRTAGRSGRLRRGLGCPVPRRISAPSPARQLQVVLVQAVHDPVLHPLRTQARAVRPRVVRHVGVTAASSLASSRSAGSVSFTQAGVGSARRAVFRAEAAELTEADAVAQRLLHRGSEAAHHCCSSICLSIVSGG